MNRREFCSSLATVTTLATCGIAAGAGRDEGLTLRRPPERFILDGRFQAARLAGAESARRGLPTTSFDGDVTALWRHDLGPAWASRRTPVAGITTPEAFLCLEQMARDAWMGVTVYAEHGGREALACGHRVLGRTTEVDRIVAALAPGPGWPARLAAALTTASADAARYPAGRRIVRVGEGIGATAAVPLVSWMIA